MKQKALIFTWTLSASAIQTQSASDQGCGYGLGCGFRSATETEISKPIQTLQTYSTRHSVSNDLTLHSRPRSHFRRNYCPPNPTLSFPQIYHCSNPCTSVYETVYETVLTKKQHASVLQFFVRQSIQPNTTPQNRHRLSCL